MINPAPPARLHLRRWFALGSVLAVLLGAAALRSARPGQGVQDGAAAGNKAAGPVGGVLGGAIGGVVGVFTGVLGVAIMAIRPGRQRPSKMPARTRARIPSSRAPARTRTRKETAKAGKGAKASKEAEERAAGQQG